MERRLAAILSADVVGYSRMIRADEEGNQCLPTSPGKGSARPKTLSCGLDTRRQRTRHASNIIVNKTIVT